MVLALAVGGCLGQGGNTSPVADGQPESSAAVDESPTPDDVAEDVAGVGVLGPAPATSRAPSPSRKPSAKPSRKPVTISGPPPPPPAADPLPPGTKCPYKDGADASRSDVRAALVNAANHAFWATSAPSIKVPVNLIKAIAWQESGWQSAIVACDGGIGTMQVMPATADWMNQRFGTSYDEHKLAGNTMIGAALLEWTASSGG